MGQKISPTSFRLGIQTEHHSNWFIDPRNGIMKKIYPALLLEDKFVRDYVTEKITSLLSFPIDSIRIRRNLKFYAIDVHVGLLENIRMVVPSLFLEQLHTDLEREMYYYREKISFFFNLKKFPFFKEKKPKIIRKEEAQHYAEKYKNSFTIIKDLEIKAHKEYSEKQQKLGHLRQWFYSEIACDIMGYFFNKKFPSLSTQQVEKYGQGFQAELNKMQLAQTLLLPNFGNINRNLSLYRDPSINGNKSFWNFKPPFALMSANCFYYF